MDKTLFVDEAVITCEAGRGGNGCHSLDRSKPGFFKATGGDGGTGGDVYLVAEPNIHTLLDFQFNRIFKAGDGVNGSSNNKTGRTGIDLEIAVPVGTEILDNKTGELLRDLNEPGLRVQVCRGGIGGHGNDRHRDAAQGAEGEIRELRLKLKLIADIGIIGFPNAGKSTFISRASNAKSKVAAYPFTTKNPVLGVVKFENGDSLVLADIPGIIEGAHEGRGMGFEFLKHVERAKVLLHVIDFAAVDGRDPLTDYKVMNEELSGYSKVLAEKEQILVANKMDVPEAVEHLKAFRKKFKKEIFAISAVTGEGVRELLNELRGRFNA